MSDQQDTFDVNFTLNYSLSKRSLDKDGRAISIPVHCNNYSFLYHLNSDSLEVLIEQLKQKIKEVEELWISQPTTN
jgi:hypothetical protein